MTERLPCVEAFFRGILYLALSAFATSSAFAYDRTPKDTAMENHAAKAFSQLVYRETGHAIKRIRPPAYLDQLCQADSLERRYPTLIAFQVVPYADSQQLQVGMSDVFQMWSHFGDTSHPPLLVSRQTFRAVKRYAVFNCTPRQTTNRLVIAVFEREPVFDPPDWMREWAALFWP